MKKITLLLLTAALFFSCENSLFNETKLSLTENNTELTPVKALSFDHYPSQEEIYAHLSDTRAYNDLGYPMNPLSGQKLVTLVVKTGNGSNDGTDSPCYFQGTWKVNGVDKTYDLMLDNPNRDDQERNKYYVYYYIITVGSGYRDTLYRGRVYITDTDGWGCEFVEVQDRNYRSQMRINRLVINDWIDTPKKGLKTYSVYRYAANTSILYY